MHQYHFQFTFLRWKPVLSYHFLFNSQRLNDQFHLCFEKFCQLPVNLEVGFQLLSSLEVKVGVSA